jgi:hypothetical protein
MILSFLGNREANRLGIAPLHLKAEHELELATLGPRQVKSLRAFEEPHETELWLCRLLKPSK